MIEVRTKTIHLDQPVRVNDKEYAEITLVPPKVGWRLRAARYLRGGETAENLTRYNSELIGKCAGVEAAVIEELYESDSAAALEFVQSFAKEPQTDAEPDEFSRTIEFPVIKFDGRDYTSLILGRTRLGWRRQAEGHLRSGTHAESLTNYAVALVSKSAAVDQRLILALEDDYFFDCWWFVASFLPGGPAITTA